MSRLSFAVAALLLLAVACEPSFAASIDRDGEPGIRLHAQALETIMQGDWPTDKSLFADHAGVASGIASEAEVVSGTGGQED